MSPRRKAVANDHWETPQDLFAIINKRFAFTLDVCATRANCKVIVGGVPAYLGPDRPEVDLRDGLCVTWKGHRCWCNPPYSAPEAWIEKAAAEFDATTVMLLPVDTSTKWFEAVYYTATEVWFLRPRVTFTGAHGSPRWANMIVVWAAADEPLLPVREGPPLFLHWNWKGACNYVEIQKMAPLEGRTSEGLVQIPLFGAPGEEARV